MAPPDARTEGREPAAPRDSASVLLLREPAAGGGGFEVYMVKRHGKSAFMGGAHVFPGGTVDPEDRAESLGPLAPALSTRTAAERLGEDDEPLAMALFCTAVRETFEEAGVLLADVPDGADLGAWRARAVAGTPFEEILRALGATLRPERLIPHSRWITPVIEPRRYDTRFFVTRAPADQRAEHDRRETTTGAWLSPETALEQGRAGRILLAPPTLRTLESLALHDSVDAVLEDAAWRPPMPITPELKQLEDHLALCLPGDPEHSVRERALTGPTRLVLEDGGWRSREGQE